MYVVHNPTSGAMRRPVRYNPQSVGMSYISHARLVAMERRPATGPRGTLYHMRRQQQQSYACTATRRSIESTPGKSDHPPALHKGRRDTASNALPGLLVQVTTDVRQWTRRRPVPSRNAGRTICFQNSAATYPSTPQENKKKAERDARISKQNIVQNYLGV